MQSKKPKRNLDRPLSQDPRHVQYLPETSDDVRRLTDPLKLKMSFNEFCKLSHDYTILLKFFRARVRDPRVIGLLKPGERIMALTIQFRGAFKPVGRIPVSWVDDAICNLQVGVTPEATKADAKSESWRLDLYNEFQNSDRLRRKVSERQDLARERQELARGRRESARERRAKSA